jgi:carbonic anhydrase
MSAMKSLIRLSALARHHLQASLLALGLACLYSFAMLGSAYSADHSQHAAPPKELVEATPRPETTAKPAPSESTGKDIAAQLREAMGPSDGVKKRLTLVITPKGQTVAFEPGRPVEKARAAPAISPAVHRVQTVAYAPVARAKVAAFTGHNAPSAQPTAHGHDIHWSYAGEGGPQTWGQLKPEFNTCAAGKRQSPIHIEEANTLQGPAEAIQFSYQPSNATVINNGHTIQVDVVGDNSITIRGSTYKLLQFHFHHPSEERVNYKTYSMVAHLVHRNLEGQLAVVGVLLDPGLANNLIKSVWTYMPLDSGDAVRMPAGLLDLNELLPKDQRYYQFLGSLTTPPCTEGVLWMVLKTPVTLGNDQLKLFGQLFPNNARPIQLANGRPIRSGQ